MSKFVPIRGEDHGPPYHVDLVFVSTEDAEMQPSDLAAKYGLNLYQGHWPEVEGQLQSLEQVQNLSVDYLGMISIHGDKASGPMIELSGRADSSGTFVELEYETYDPMPPEWRRGVYREIADRALKESNPVRRLL